MTKTKWRRTVLAAIAAIAVAATAACSAQGGDEGANDVLRVRLAGSPISSDPFREISTYPWDVMRNVYEGLVSLDENYDPIPMLAESWEQDDAGTEFTFTLREGVKFHDGKDLTAADVAYSLNYYREKAFRASDLANMSAVEAVDPLTVKVTLSKPWGNFLVALGAPIGPVIVPEGSADDDGLVTDPIGTGPYKIDSFSESAVKLSKFEDYQSVDLPTSGFGGAKNATVDKVDITVVEETQTTLAGMETDEYDIVTEFPPLETERASSMPGWTLKDTTGTQLNNMYINAGDDGLPDAKIRSAILAAIDRDKLLESTGRGAGKVTHSYISPDASWFDEDSSNYWPWDGGVEQAKQILADSNYAGEPIEIMSGLDDQHDNAVLVGQELEAAGFKVKLTKLDFAAYLERLNAGEFQLAATGTAARIPVDNLYNEWYCAGGTLDKRFGYCNAEYDALYEQAVATVDADARNALFAQLERKLKDEAVIDPWYFIDNVVAVRDNVETFEPATSGFLSLWTVALKS